ncbi:MAG: ribonuclease E/G [Pseudomonadota bacterium]
MSNKMLIDASHPEETRVVVTNDKRLADFDFESEHKSQIRGNIYLAKVTRVEPSLQAAFVDFGGNRHGFLAFSEIHPDYYQIPLADRQALLEEEEAFANAEADDEEEQAENERKGRRRRRRRGRGRRSNASAVPDAEPVAMDAILAAYEAGDEDDSDDSDDDEPRGKAIAATVDDDDAAVISEPAVDDEDSNDDEDDSDEVDEVGDGGDALEDSRPRRRAPRRRYKIQEVIKRRQVILVQVVKEERGNKGAALTTYLSLAGRYSVLMPNTARGGGISRKISNVSDRKRLKDVVKKLDVPKGMGVILRTAGADQSEQEVVRDYEYLMRLWDSVRDLTLSSTAPALVYAEGSLIKRSLRDLFNPNIREVIVAGDTAYEEAKEFMGMIMPGNKGIVKRWRDAAPIFAKTGMEDELDRLIQPQVTLKSGGYLIINQTEALVAIDVNSGKSTKEHSIEETALATNLEAAEEVARQLRLRDLAGLIVIDFIDMDENRNNRAVEKKLKECLKTDRARIQVGRISHFGLMEMSRQRMRASVLESTMSVCPTCNGTGYVRSPQAVALHLLRSLEEQLTRNSKFDLNIKTPVDTALYLLNKKRDTLSEMEDRFGVTLTVEADNSIGAEMFAVDRAGSANKPTRVNAAVGMGLDMVTSEDEDDAELDGASLAEIVETAADNDDDDQGQSRKKRRRRRGGKGRDRADNGDAENLEAQSDDDEPGDDDEGEGRGRKRRRRSRGKRGGRNRRNDRYTVPAAEPVGPLAELIAQQEQDADKTADDAREPEATEPEEALAINGAAEASAPIAEENSETTAETIDPSADDSAPADAEAPVEEDANGARPRATASTLNLDVEPVVVSSANGSEAEEDKPKKRAGWWSRKGFF